MKTNFFLLFLLFTQFATAQNAPTHEQAYGFIGFESSAIQVIEPAFLQGQYFLGGQLNKTALLVQSNKVGQSLAYRQLSLGNKGESRITDLVKINSKLFAVAGTCTGCADTISRQSVFITLHNPALNQVATLVLSPNATQDQFNNARLASDGTRLYLAFNDNFFGGSLNVRAFDFNLKQLWSSFQNLGFVETPLSIDVHNGQLWVCSQEWNGFESTQGTHLARFNPQSGALINHFGYAAFVDAFTILPNGNFAMAAYGNFYTGNKHIKLAIVSPNDGAIIDSVLLGAGKKSRATAIQALPDGNLLLAINEEALFINAPKLLRYNPARLSQAISSRTIVNDRGALDRVIHDLHELSNDGTSYIAVGNRTDGGQRGMFLASFSEPFTPQAPLNLNNVVCGTKLLSELKQSHYPACLPQVYQKVVYEKGAVSYIGGKTDLSMDLYVPYDLHTTNDLNQKRPLIVLVHGGEFILGGENELQHHAIFLAELGYVVASISYRVGVAFGVNRIEEFCDHKKEVYAAMYRATQDTRKAIQFLYDNANLYHIDRNNIMALGHGSGAVNVLNSAFLDADELPFNFVNDLGPLPPKPPVKAYISWAGSISSLDMIDPEENTPMFFIHGTCDPLMPYDEGNLICPELPFGFGAKAIVARKKSLCHNYHLLGIQKGDHAMGGSDLEVMIKLLDWMKYQVMCGPPKQTCESITAKNPLNCAETTICPSTQSCLVATREARPTGRQAHIYPNPAANNSIINIELEEEMGSDGELYLYNAQGQELRWEKFIGKAFQLEVQNLTPGIYLLKIRTDQQVIKSQLVIK